MTRTIQISTDNRRPPRVQTRFLIRDNNSFAAIRLNVNASKDAVKEMRAGLVDLFKILQEADNTVILNLYKTILKEQSGLQLINKSNVITKPSNIPCTITSIAKYFFRARLQENGGTVYCKMRIGHQWNLKN